MAESRQVERKESEQVTVLSDEVKVVSATDPAVFTILIRVSKSLSRKIQHSGNKTRGRLLFGLHCSTGHTK